MSSAALVAMQQLTFALLSISYNIIIYNDMACSRAELQILLEKLYEIKDDRELRKTIQEYLQRLKKINYSEIDIDFFT